MEGHIRSSWNQKKKEMTIKQIKIWSEKVLCHERRGVIWEYITKRQTKLWSWGGPWKSKQKDNSTHWHQRKERHLKTLTYDFQKLETSLWEKDTQKP